MQEIWGETLGRRELELLPPLPSLLDDDETRLWTFPQDLVGLRVYNVCVCWAMPPCTLYRVNLLFVTPYRVSSPDVRKRAL